MTSYLIRRIFQMILVVFFAALFTYFLFDISPGGPTLGFQQQVRRVTRQDIARVRAQYELDLYWPTRFARWLVGFPTGPITVGGRELFATVPVGCYLPRDEQVVINENGERVTVPAGCDQYVYPADLPALHPVIKSSKGVLRADFGLSSVILKDRPVTMLLGSRIGPTLLLMTLSLMLSLLIGVPIGIYSAVKQYSRFDYFFTTISFIGSAMPTFFFALLMILAFTVFPVMLVDKVPWIPHLPPGSRVSERAYQIASWLPEISPKGFADQFLHLLMPVAVLTFFYMSSWSRFVRSSMLEVMRQDYVRTAQGQRTVGAGRDRQACVAQRADPVRDRRCPGDPRPFCRGDHHRDGVRLARHGPALLRRLDPQRLAGGAGLYPDLHRADRLRHAARRHSLHRG